MRHNRLGVLDKYAHVPTGSEAAVLGVFIARYELRSTNEECSTPLLVDGCRM